MKFFKYSILAMMGLLAVSFTACSDDDDYSVGTQSPGAYFADALPSSIELSLEASSFDVTVSRTNADAPDTYNLTLTDPSGLFTAPSRVVFADGALTAPVTITYDPTKVEADKDYPLSLTLEGASQYGDATYSFVVNRVTPLESEDLGAAVYTYSGVFYDGSDTGINVIKSWNPSTPNHVYYTVQNWGDKVDLVIEVPDMSDVEDGLTTVFVHPQFTGYTHSTYGKVWIADLYSYWVEYRKNPTGTDAIKDDSYFNIERGLFTLSVDYYVPEYGTGASHFGSGIEYLQLSGYPDLSVSAEYTGTIIQPGNASYSATARVTPGEDVAKFKAYMLAGDDHNAIITAILSEADGVVEVTGNEPATVEFSLEEGGTYTIGVVTFDEAGEAGEYGYTTFEVEIGAPKWNSLGVSDFVDPFLVPGFLKAEYTNADCPWSVELLQSTEDPNAYALNKPYSSEDFLLIDLNETTLGARIKFDVTNPNCVIFPIQNSGFKNQNNFGDAQVQVSNYEGFLLENNPGASYDAIIATVDKNELEHSTFEDNVVTIGFGMFSSKGEFGYNWKSMSPGFIFFPEADDAVKHKVVARKVTRPALKGMLKTARGAQMIKRDKHFKTEIAPVKKLDKVSKSVRLK